MALLIFGDTETTGLNYFETDEVWMIHLKAAFTGHKMHHDEFTRLVEVNPEKILQLPKKFQDLYEETWNDPALQHLKTDKYTCGNDLVEWLRKAGGETMHFIAANPAFDSKMIMQEFIPPDEFFTYFHYHMIDIEAFALGWLRNMEITTHEIIHSFIEDSEAVIRESFLPFRSDDLSKMLGVYQEGEHKHEAISDTDWIIRMWLKMNGGKF